jgi:type I restriction enzyme S subunit
MTDGWKSRCLQECVERVKCPNKVPRKSFLTSGPYPIISQEKDFINGHWLDDKDLLRIKKPVVIFGDHTQVIKYVDFDFVLGADGVKILQTKEFIEPRFLFYFLIGHPLKELGHARHYRILKELEVSYPESLSEQRRIVDILDETFEVIRLATANTQRNLTNARELFESYLNAVFTRKSEDWPHHSLEQLTDEDTKITYGVVKPGLEGDVLFIRGGDISKGRIRTEKLRTITQEVSDQYKRTLLRGGEILMCLVGVPGQTAVAPAELRGANVARQVGLIRLHQEINPHFISLFLRSRIGLKGLGTYTGGSVQQVINLRDLKKVRVPLPDRSVQDETVAFLQQIGGDAERLENRYQRRIDNLVELKQSILRRAFSGRLRTQLDQELEEAVA